MQASFIAATSSRTAFSSSQLMLPLNRPPRLEKLRALLMAATTFSPVDCGQLNDHCELPADLITFLIVIVYFEYPSLNVVSEKFSIFFTSSSKLIWIFFCHLCLEELPPGGELLAVLDSLPPRAVLLLLGLGIPAVEAPGKQRLRYFILPIVCC